MDDLSSILGKFFDRLSKLLDKSAPNKPAEGNSPPPEFWEDPLYLWKASKIGSGLAGRVRAASEGGWQVPRAGWNLQPPEAGKMSGREQATAAFKSLFEPFFGKGVKGPASAREQLGAGLNLLTAAGMGHGSLGKMFKWGELGARAMEGDPTAILGLVKEGVNEMKQRIGEMGKGIGELSRLGGGVAPGREGTALGAGFRAGGHFAKAALPPLIGDLVERGMKFSAVLLESVDRLQKWNWQLVQTNFQFAEFSGAMASVQAEQMVRDIEFSRERGEARAAHTQRLAEAASRLRGEIAPAGDFLDKFSAENQRFWTEALSETIRLFKAGTRPGATGGVGGVLAEFIDFVKNGPQSAGGGDLNKDLDRFLGGWDPQFYERFGKPERFGVNVPRGNP